MKAKITWAEPQYLTTDLVLFTIENQRLKVLLVRRVNDPYKGRWGLPGGYVQTEESLDEAAHRLLREKTGARDVHLEQLFTFGDMRRGSRMKASGIPGSLHPGPMIRVVTTAYFGVTCAKKLRLDSLDGSRNTHLFGVHQLPPMAFDHEKIIEVGLERLRHKVNYTTICHQLLEDGFTLPELQKMYEIILAQRLDKRNFRKKMLQLGILKNLNQTRRETTGRPARLYSFARPGVVKLQEKGILVPF